VDEQLQLLITTFCCCFSFSFGGSYEGLERWNEAEPRALIKRRKRWNLISAVVDLGGYCGLSKINDKV